VAGQTGHFVTGLSQPNDEAAPTPADLKPRGVLTVPLVVGWLLLLTAAACAAAYAFGVLSASHGHFWVNPRGASSEEFDWPNAMLAATAAGTILLGAFTAALAYTTSGDVSATWRLAQLTAEDQAAREAPVLIVAGTEITMTGDATYTDPQEGDEQGVFSFEIAGSVRNVGLGPAVKVRLALDYTGDADDMIAFSPTAVIPVIDPGGAEARTFLFYRPYGDWRPEEIRADDFSVRPCSFWDRRGRRYGNDDVIR
jgi:hypothetical protein